jgi:hypothetical protein
MEGWEGELRNWVSDAKLSSGMDVGKELNVKLGMRECLVSARQSGWRQERVGIRTGDSGLDENEVASQRTAVRLVLAGRLLPTVRLGSPGLC